MISLLNEIPFISITCATVSSIKRKKIMNYDKSASFESMNLNGYGTMLLFHSHWFANECVVLSINRRPHIELRESIKVDWAYFSTHKKKNSSAFFSLSVLMQSLLFINSIQKYGNIMNGWKRTQKRERILHFYTSEDNKMRLNFIMIGKEAHE